MFSGTFRYLLILVGNLNCSSSLFDSGNLIIFKWRNYKFDVKDNFVNNLKNSNAWRFLKSYALKSYEARSLENYLLAQILYRSVDPAKKQRGVNFDYVLAS